MQTEPKPFKSRPCPICGKPSTLEFHPFDSARCKDIDLNRWLSGVYVIPGDALEEEEKPETESGEDE
jgi:endogenous inhibitor of DNA gyrase (YacG/DUF329 family)